MILDARNAMMVTVAAVAIVAQATPACAQSMDERRVFNIPAQPVADAILAFSRQSNIQVVTASADIGTRQSRAVRGRLTGRTALERLLEGTGLTWRQTSQGSIVVAPVSGEAEAGGAAADSGSAHADEAIIVIGRPELLGGQSLNADIPRSRDAAQPYAVYSRETIQRSGATDLESFFRQRVPANVSTQSNSQVPGSTSGGASSINLRGLGANQTLILIDGRRAASFAIGGNPQQPDINNIPLSAIERIEVLPSTASGIYGGGATGGVINVVLRSDFNGFEGRVGYGNAFSSDVERRLVSASGGFSLGPTTNVMLSASYSDGDGLAAGDRDYLRRGRALILANNPGTFFGGPTPPIGATTNIRSVDGSNLVLRSGGALNSPITFVPVGYAGPASDNGAALIANAGRFNLAPADTAQSAAGTRQSLLNEPVVVAGSLAIRQRISDVLRAFLEVRASRNESEALVNQANTTFVIAANAANNPFTQAIRVTVPGLGADRPVRSEIETLALTGGLTVNLGSRWRGALDLSRHWTNYNSSFPAGLTTAGGTAVTSGQIDVFRDFGANTTPFLPFVGLPTEVADVVSTFTSVAARISGPAIRLPGGPIMLTGLAEYRREGLRDYVQTSATGQTLFPARSQSIRSGYAEAIVPIFAQENRRLGLELLELQLAARYDDYTTNAVTGSVAVGSTTPVVRNRVRFDALSPTIALRYRPIPDLMLRASYGSGFLPPSVTQLVPAAPRNFTAAQAATLGLRDPSRGNEPLGAFTLVNGGNPDLSPEESESYSIGAILTPGFAPSLRLSVDWTRIDKTNNISVLTTSQDSINIVSAFAPERITRGPVTPGDVFNLGRITALDLTFLNLAETRVEAWDFALDYEVELPRLGTLTLFGAATHQQHNRSRVTPTAAPVEFAGLISNLRWRGNAGASFETGPLLLQMTGRYYSGYWLSLARTVNANQGAARIGSQIFVDLYARYKMTRGTDLSLSVANLFNRSPRIDVVNAQGVFYSSVGDPRRAHFMLEVRTRF